MHAARLIAAMATAQHQRGARCSAAANRGLSTESDCEFSDNFTTDGMNCSAGPSSRQRLVLKSGAPATLILRMIVHVALIALAARATNTRDRDRANCDGML